MQNIKIVSAAPRSDEQIVEQTNEMARVILNFIGTGYTVPDDHKFYDSEDPRSLKAWEAACELQELLTDTDPNDALANLPDTRPYTVTLRETVIYTVELEAVDDDEAERVAQEMWEKCENPDAAFGGQGQGVEVVSCELGA